MKTEREREENNINLIYIYKKKKEIPIKNSLMQFQNGIHSYINSKKIPLLHKIYLNLNFKFLSRCDNTHHTI